MKIPLSVFVLAAIVLTGCAVGPDYHRPVVQTPSAFRAPTPQPTPEAASLADLKWWEVFKDEKLQELIRTSLVENYDLRDAVARVEAARANLGITRSEQFPNADVGGNITTPAFPKWPIAAAGVVCALTESHLWPGDAQPALL